MIKEIAYAKVNLFLNVTGKRKDGYHTLEMLNAKIDMFDVLEFRKIDFEAIVIIKSNDIFLSNQDNIVVQVARYMLKTYEINSGLEITIDKKIPFGAGLAGNSADSAAVIKGIDKLFELNLSLETMREIALMYGADIPYCLTDKPAFVKGIGEIIEEVDLDLSEYQVLLINPVEYVGTKEVFELADKQGFTQKDMEILNSDIVNNDIDSLQLNLFNSLEEVVLNNYPFMKEFKELLIKELGSEGLVMTGSGSSFLKILHKKHDFSDFIARYNKKYLIKKHNFL